MKREMKTLCAACLWAVLSSFLLTGEGAGEAEAASQGNEVFSYEWIAGHWATPPDPDGLMTAVLEEEWNVDIEFQWVPNGALKEKINVLVNSGDYPDVCTLPKTWVAPNTPAEYEAWAQEDIFVDLKPYIEEYGPNIKEQIPARLFEIGTGLLDGEVSGAYYGIPNVTAKNNGVMAYRSDWLEKFGMVVPVTLDDWYAYWVACTFEDPDGNGKDDTYGYCISNDGGFYYAPILMGYDLLPGYPYLDESGELIPYNLTDRYFEALKYLNGMWEAGLIDPSTISLNGNNIASQKFDTGKLGTVRVGTNNLIWRRNFLVKAIPEADVDIAALPVMSDGVNRTSEGFAFHRDTALFYPVEEEKNGEEKIARFIQMWNWTLSEEGQDFITWGIEGRNYSGTGDSRKSLPAWETDNVNNFRILFTADPEDRNMIPRYRESPVQAARQKEEYARVSQYLVNNPVMTISKTQAEMNQLEYINYEKEAFFNMATGIIPINDATIAEYRETWMVKGGDQFMEEWKVLVEERKDTRDMKDWLKLVKKLEKNW